MSYLLYNAIIHGHPRADSILIVQDSIYHVGSKAECKILSSENTNEIDLRGKMLLPAFCDAHTHFVEYAKSRLLVNLIPCHSITDIEAELARYRKELSYDAKWILGGGWNRNVLDDPMALNKYLV
ncbi:MAG TPA: amidohydrolase family protein, partial [Candidatus Cloacimonadota bacterium]|nr:amidohydrolase family protein [Candidatus Cloacimonadota bacterium]